MRILKFNERYSLPDSVQSISDELFNVIVRKSKSTTFDFIPKDRNNDFPVNKVKVKLILTQSKEFRFKGASHVFGSPNTLRPKLHSNKMVDIGIEIEIKLPIGKSISDYKDTIQGLLYHEILHSFQSYKKELKGERHEPSSLSFTIMELRNTLNLKTWTKFLKLVYITSSKEELDAGLSSTQVPIWNSYYKNLYKEIYDNYTKDELKRILIKELKDDTSSFVKLYNKISSKYKSNKYIEFNKLFEDLYKLPLLRKKYIERKLAKTKL